MPDLKDLRQSLGLTQVQMAKQLGVTLRYVKFLEAGERHAGRLLARKIARMVGKGWCPTCHQPIPRTKRS